MTYFSTFGAALAALLATTPVAEASRPVPRAIAGCVAGGVLTSDDGYPIRLRAAGGAPIDLSRYEGRRIRARGLLSPGDIFVIRGRPLLLGPCRR